MRVLAPTQYAFDMSGVHPDNLVVKEPLTLDPDTGASVVIPQYGPFYTEGFALHSPDGALLIQDTDYRFYSLMGELTAYTNKPVAGIIELLRPGLTEVVATYQCLGDTDFWDSSLLKLIINAVEDDRPVYWEDLKDKPLAFPSAVHGHSFIYQMTAFTEFVKFTEDLLTRFEDSPRLIELKVTNLIALIDSSITRYKAMLDDLVASHESAYNAHGLTKAQVGLGNVDNFPTATINQAKQGESNRLHLTPPGLAAIINEFGYDESQLLPKFRLALSMYGNRSFIPPSMDGSYEAMGTSVTRAGYCIEEDGNLSVLSPRTDGKTKGLYFSQVTDFNDSNKIQFSYTGVRYDHPRLRQDGVRALEIAGGSNYQLMMIGDTTVDGLYITLTNGTFNPEKHVLKRVTSELTTLPGYGLYDKTIAHLGDRVMVTVNLSRTFGYNTETFGRLKMYYILMEELLDPTREEVSLRDWFISYDMPDGTKVVNDQYLNLSPMVLDPEDPGKMKQLYFTFPKSRRYSGGGYRSINVTCAVNPLNDKQHVVNVARAGWITYPDDNGVNKGIGFRPEVIWVREGDKFTLVDHTPTEDPNLGNLGLTAHGHISTRTGQQNHQCSSMLSNGQRVTTYEGYNGLVALVERCDKQPYEWLSKCSFTKNHTITTVTKAELFAPPTLRGVIPVEVTWTRTGYIVTHRSPKTGGLVRTQVQLHEEGPKSNLPFHNWEDRPEVVLADGPCLSLPLPTTTQESVYEKTYNSMDVAITGDDAFCASVSTGYGLNLEGSYGITAKTGGLGVFPSSLGSGGDNGVLLYDGAGELLYYPSTIINQLRALVGDDPTIHPIWAVAIADFTANVNKNNGYAGSWNPNLAVATVVYGRYSPSKPSKYGKTFVIRPVIENNVNGLYNAAYPRIVTSITVMDTMNENPYSSTEVSMSSTNWNLGIRLTSSGTQKRTFQGYVTGDTMAFAFETPLLSAVTGDSLTVSLRGVLNLKTGKITSFASYNLGSGWNTSTYLAVSRIGLVKTSVSPSTYGNCAWVVPVSPNRVCIYNTYLKDGWFIYVAESDAVFRGTVTKMPAQTIDVREADPDYTNSLFYIYATDEINPPGLYLSKEKIEEGEFHLWVGTCETDASGIKTITRQNVLSINGIRFGTNRGGSTILASSGSVNSHGSIPWFSRDDVV